MGVTKGSIQLLQFRYIVLHSKNGPGGARSYLCNIIHLPDKVMQIQILALLFIFQVISSGTPNSGTTGSSAANIVFQSVDGGQTWQDVSAGLPENLEINSVFFDGQEVYLGSETSLFHSIQPPAVQMWEGQTFANDKFTRVYPGQTGMYACNYGEGLYRESLPGIWTPMHQSLNDLNIHTVLETPEGVVFAGCDSGIFKTTDGGATWKKVFSEGMVVHLVASDGVMIGSGFKGLLRSTDGGEHWDWVLTEGGQASQTIYRQGRFFAVTNGVHPWKDEASDPNALIGNLYTSADGGKTWQRMDEGLSAFRYVNLLEEDFSREHYINDIEQAGEYLFCSLDTGIYRSADLGKTWNLVFPASGRRSLNLVASGKVIYAVVVIGC